LAALAGAGLGYGFGLEPRSLDLRTVHVSLPLPSPVRILHLADLHRSRFVGLGFLEKALRRGLEQAPDLICLTGDFITAGDSTTMDGYVDVLRLLSSRAPTFAVYGNHDGGAWSRGRGGEETPGRVASLLSAAGIQVLNNRSTMVDTNGGSLQLAGTGDLWGGDCKPSAALDARTSNATPPTVLLAHNPDTKEVVRDLAWDLMLSGHTHGGQVAIPFFGPPFVPVQDLRYVAGLNYWGERFNCRPEVTSLDVA